MSWAAAPCRVYLSSNSSCQGMVPTIRHKTATESHTGPGNPTAVGDEIIFPALSKLHFAAIRVMAFPYGSVTAGIVWAGRAKGLPDGPGSSAFGASGRSNRHTALSADDKGEVL